jgi:hypothetical protein
MISESRKSLVAGAIGFLTPIATVLAATDQPLDARVVAAAVVSGLITGGTTWLVRNGDKA